MHEYYYIQFNLPDHIIDKIYYNICDIITIDFKATYIFFINPYTNITLKIINGSFNNIYIEDQFIYSYTHKINYYNMINDIIPTKDKLDLITKMYHIHDYLKDERMIINYAISNDNKYYVSIFGTIQNCKIEIFEVETNKMIKSKKFNMDYIFMFEDFGTAIKWNNNSTLIAFSIYRVMAHGSKIHIFDTDLNTIDDFKISNRATILNWGYNKNVLVSLDEHENKVSIIYNNIIKYICLDSNNYIISAIITPNDKQLIINSNNLYKIYNLF